MLHSGWCANFKYRRTSLSTVYLSADSLNHKCKNSLKCQISSQNVSFYLRIQYLRSKIISTANNEVYLYSQRYERQKAENSCFEVFLIYDVIAVQSDNCLSFSETHIRRNSIQTET